MDISGNLPIPTKENAKTDHRPQPNHQHPSITRPLGLSLQRPSRTSQSQQIQPASHSQGLQPSEPNSPLSCHPEANPTQCHPSPKPIPGKETHSSQQPLSQISQ